MVVLQGTLLLARLKLIEDAEHTLSTSLLQPVNPSARGFNEWVAVIHARQLDLLSKIFMLFEDFLTYSNVLRTDPSKLSLVLASKSSNYDAEVDYLSNMKITDLQYYFLIGDPSSYVQTEDRPFIRHAIKLGLADTQRRLVRLCRFWRDYYHIYLKFKHRFSAIVGLYEVQGRNVSSHIYVRSREGTKTYTYIVPCDLTTLTYYEEIADDLFISFRFLLDCYLAYAHNVGRPYFPPIQKNALPDSYWPRLQPLVDRMPFIYITPALNLNIRMRGKRAGIASRSITKRHVYRAPFDVYTRGRRKLTP